MLAISPQFCSSGWFLDDPFIHEPQNTNCFSRERTETSDSIDLHSPSSRTQPKNGEFASNFSEGFINGDGDKMAKKLNHNASERDRRKRINTLYANLRSLLPHEDQSRKLSIPATVSKVLKYIPELQKEMERLIQKKERIMSKISMVEESSLKFKNQKIKPIQKSCSAVSATRINDAEIIIQSSMPKSEKGSFSEAIMRLEEEGLVMMNASCFESFEGRVFCNFHLQAQEGQVVDAEILKEKVWPFI